MAPLETVHLCDTVHVYFEKLGINASAKVVHTEYDVLNERLASIQVGDSQTNLYESITDSVSSEAVAKASDIMTRAIDHATNLITGGLGGYVVIGKNGNGEPEEILIMDTNNKATATNVIRMNQNGIGFSTSGYNGPFTTAWTIDGGFVADFITSGTIDAITITGSTISGGTISSPVMIFGGSKKASIRDGSYTTYDHVQGSDVTVYGPKITDENNSGNHVAGLIIDGGFAFESTIYPALVRTRNDHRLQLVFGSSARKIDNRVDSGEALKGLYIANDTGGSCYICLTEDAKIIMYADNGIWANGTRLD